LFYIYVSVLATDPLCRGWQS